MSENDVRDFMCVFTNSGICQNYISTPRFIGAFLGADNSWCGPRVVQMLSGVDKLLQQRQAGVLLDKKLMIQMLLEKLIAVADVVNRSGFVDFIAVGLAFWCRMQSEAIPLPGRPGGSMQFRHFKAPACVVECNAYPQGPCRFQMSVRWGQHRNRPVGSFRLRMPLEKGTVLSSTSSHVEDCKSQVVIW